MVRSLLLALLAGLPTLPANSQQGATPQAAPAQAGFAAWPHTLVRDGATVTVYQPQATAWPERKRLSARAALSIVRPGEKHPLMGTIDLSLATAVDAATGVVNLSDPQLISTHFPSLDTQQAAALEAKVRAALTAMEIRQVPLASVQLSLKQLPVTQLSSVTSHRSFSTPSGPRVWWCSMASPCWCRPENPD